MALRILVVPDKFKGTLSAAEAAGAIARGWRRSRPADRLELLPMSDGGDGFGAVMGGLLGCEMQTVRTVDAAHQPCSAKWWWQAATRTAVIESAQVIGLARLPAGRFHPFELDTCGLGAVLEAAASMRAQRCIIGIGGSATNDGGFGLARAAGWQFCDGRGREIEAWTGLGPLGRVGAPPRRRWFQELIVAVDVQNPLLGPRGATRVYGPQKGLKPRDFPRAERSLARLAQAAKRVLRVDHARRPGAGAAGGLGFGLMAFLGARPVPGFQIFADHSRLERRVRAADLVITGEGAIDRSTLMGKGVSQVAALSARAEVPCIALGGLVALTKSERARFSCVRALTELTTAEKARAEPGRWLELLAQEIARKGVGS
jgi:glycerate kinase